MGTYLSEAQVCHLDSNVKIGDHYGRYFGELERIDDKLTPNGVGIYKTDQNQIFIGNFTQGKFSLGNDYFHLDLNRNSYGIFSYEKTRGTLYEVGRQFS
jgi:hypothetical protein